MENNVNHGEPRRLKIFRLISILGYTSLLVAMGISLFTRDWTADNLLKTVMIVATWLVVGIFLFVGAFYYRFATAKMKSIGWRQAFVYLYISGIVLMILVGLVSLVGVIVEGKWSNRPIYFLGIAAANMFFLLPPMWRDMKRKTSEN
jgi:hypothetical protein